MLASNSEFWYVDAGMKHMLGDDWQRLFDVVVVTAGKPAFYTQSKPFRQVSKVTGAIDFKPISELRSGLVYCDGSIEELSRLKGWDKAHVVYLGDSLFADLVEARRLWGWTTGAIIPEVRQELRAQSRAEWGRARHAAHALRRSMRLVQAAFAQPPAADGAAGVRPEHRRYSAEDIALLDALERLAADFMQYDEDAVNRNFGSVFRAAAALGSRPSFFARCLQRHVDFYTSSVVNLGQYSVDHRWYPHEKHVGIPAEERAVGVLLCEPSAGASSSAAAETVAADDTDVDGE
eukprot:TRINITY_DN65109_c0_g1_i1.p1 TRINITY_DN65109_c0_g1~~TRINITY_DN65109_c0_g1_i1.p1  ORF type:complete len:291 (-),score=76.25 TRINITY_DN65109_c0_g1_i1:4-876(-)